MGMPSNLRSTYSLCGAQKKNGEFCRAFAGQGTDHPTIGRCKYHGGSTPSHRAHAVRVEAEGRALRFGHSIPIEPSEALLSVLHLSAGHLAFARDAVAQAEPASHEGQVLLRIFDDERDRLARVAKACIDAGVAERQVRLAESYGEQLAHLLREVYNDPELALNATQQAALPSVLRRQLALAAGPAALTN